MNDAELGENIDQEAQRTEAVIESDPPQQMRFENDDAHLDPSRWWFASAAFPMIAGTLGPVASAFSICSLVRPWRQQLVPGANVEFAPFVPDQPWLTIVNGVQLVVAIISNAFLLLNMTKRVRFSIAQPITIIGWYISAICLVAMLSTATGPLQNDIDFPESELIWSQSFFYGMFSAILYFIVASLMSVTFWGASSGHYPKDFELTPSQRTLMLQTIMFLIYLLVGALVFSKIEDWNYLDGVYWADVTLFTVGFGDFAPETTLGRALMMPYSLIGVISLGLVIGSIRSLILDRGRRRVAARMEEKKRRRVIRTMARKGQDEVLEPIREDSDLSRAQIENGPANEFERRRKEFQLMRKIQAQSSSRRKWMAMGISTGTWLVLWLVGAVIFQHTEQPYQGWTYFESFYFSFVSLMTVGYGDFTPVSNCGKAFFVFWSLLALPTMTVLISNAGDTVVKFIRDGTLRLGNLTILPGDEDFIGSFKHICSKLSRGRLFPSYRFSAAPGLEEAKKSAEQLFAELMENTEDRAPTNDDDDDDEQRGRSPTPVRRSSQDHHQKERSSSTFTSHVRRSLSRLRNPHIELPSGTDFHFLLISEIQVIADHLKETKPHRYSFEQWAWYLKLIGEDERSPETHRKAKPKEKHLSDGEDEKGMTWSWVGGRSPLMGSKEESEWILEQLVDKLRESLSEEGRQRATDAHREANREAQEVYEKEGGHNSKEKRA